LITRHGKLAGWPREYNCRTLCVEQLAAIVDRDLVLGVIAGLGIARLVDLVLKTEAVV